VRVTTRSYDYAGGVPDAAFQITTRLGAPADRVWVWALTEEGINFELRPWLRMTHPKGLTHARAIDQAPLGELLGRSWILLRGLIPVDYDDLCLAERGPGLRFLEISELGSARRWQHERESSRSTATPARSPTGSSSTSVPRFESSAAPESPAGSSVRCSPTATGVSSSAGACPPGCQSPDPRTTPNGS